MENNLAKTSSNTAVATDNVFQFKSVEDLKSWGADIVKSGLTPLKTPEAVVAAVMMGKELGLEPMISVNNIIPINGRATLGIHLINSLLLKAGIVTEIVRNYEPCVGFALKGEDGKTYKGEDGKSNPTLLRIGFADEEPKEYEIRGKTIVDYKTVVKMTRRLKQEDGTFATMSVSASFSFSESVTAGLSGKDNWAKYPRQMCLQRATAFAGRLIGADIMLGMYETSEILDAQNIPYTVEEGKVTIIDNQAKESKSNEHFEEVTVTPIEEVKSENSTVTDKTN